MAKQQLLAERQRTGSGLIRLTFDDMVSLGALNADGTPKAEAEAG